MTNKKPVAKARAVVERTNDGDLIGILRGKMGINGDIMDSGAEWEPGDGFADMSETGGNPNLSERREGDSATKTIGAAKFKEQCLSILDNLDSEGIVVTKRGKPVARVIPIRSTFDELYGKYKDKMIVHGDIMSTGLRWDAES